MDYLGEFKTWGIVWELKVENEELDYLAEF